MLAYLMLVGCCTTFFSWLALALIYQLKQGMKNDQSPEDKLNRWERVFLTIFAISGFTTTTSIIIACLTS